MVAEGSLITQHLSSIRDIVPEDAHFIPARGGCYVIVIDNPGVAFSESAQERIYETLVPLTSAAFGADMTAYWEGRRIQRYFKRLSNFSLVINSSENIVGWSGYSELHLDGHRHVYLDSSGIVPELQSQHILGSYVSQQVATYLQTYDLSADLFISCRTESPIVYKVIRRLVKGENIWPNPSVSPTPDVRRQAILLAEWLGHPEKLDPDTLIVRGAYSNLSALYGELPSTGERDLDVLFREKLGPLDAYLLVGQRPALPRQA